MFKFVRFVFEQNGWQGLVASGLHKAPAGCRVHGHRGAALPGREGAVIRTVLEAPVPEICVLVKKKASLVNHGFSKVTNSFPKGQAGTNQLLRGGEGTVD